MSFFCLYSHVCFCFAPRVPQFPGFPLQCDFPLSVLSYTVAPDLQPSLSVQLGYIILSPLTEAGISSGRHLAPSVGAAAGGRQRWVRKLDDLPLSFHSLNTVFYMFFFLSYLHTFLLLSAPPPRHTHSSRTSATLETMFTEPSHTTVWLKF